VKKTDFFKKILTWILDLFEIYIPVITFSVMFTVFLLQVCFRYLFNSPLTWPYEITLIAFIWTTLLGACYARRMNAHVSFGLVYDSLTAKKKTMIRLVGNGIILIAFGIALYPSYDYIAFMEFQKTTVVRIPFNLVYSPFLVFLVIILGRTAYEIYTDLKQLVRVDS